MLYDRFENVDRYPQIPHLKAIEDYLQTLVDDDGRIHFPSAQEIEILGRELFVRTGNYETGPSNQKQFEAHSVYADLQLMIEGEEVMDVSLEKNPKPVTPYNSEADIQFFEDPAEIASLHVSSGQFTVFFPGDLHKPGCLAGSVPRKIKKLVFKIKMPKAYNAASAQESNQTVKR